MENQEPNKSLFDISFDENVKQSLRAAANWGGIAAIFAITDTVFGFVTHFIAKNKVETYRYEGMGDVTYRSQNADNLLSLVIVGIISGFLFYFLNRFSKLTKSGIDGNDSGLVTEGLGNLATYLKVVGIIAIIIIVLGGLGLLIILAGGDRTY